jgi:hypothetical protein
MLHYTHAACLVNLHNDAVSTSRCNGIGGGLTDEWGCRRDLEGGDRCLIGALFQGTERNHAKRRSGRPVSQLIPTVYLPNTSGYQIVTAPISYSLTCSFIRITTKSAKSLNTVHHILLSATVSLRLVAAPQLIVKQQGLTCSYEHW